jgi:hypothetical protein
LQANPHDVPSHEAVAFVGGTQAVHEDAPVPHELMLKLLKQLPEQS